MSFETAFSNFCSNQVDDPVLAVLLGRAAKRLGLLFGASPYISCTFGLEGGVITEDLLEVEAIEIGLV